MNGSKQQSCHGYRETDEWMTSQWRRGERVWNWFGGGAQGGVSHWIFVRQTHFSLLCAPVSPVDRLSLVRLCFFFNLHSFPLSTMKTDFEGDGERMCDFRSDNYLQVLTTCETNERGRARTCEWCSQLHTGNKSKGRCAVQLSRV